MDKIMVIMIGLQGSGKTEYVRRFLDDDFVRISLDILHTRNKEMHLMNECFAKKKNIVIDNTNPTQEERQKYLIAAKMHGYHVIGMYMQSILSECIVRNNKREGKARVPLKAIVGTAKKLELPDYDEGFDELFYIHNDGEVMWKDDWVE